MDPLAWKLPITRENQKAAPATREPPRIQGNGSHTAGRTNRPGPSTFQQNPAGATPAATNRPGAATRGRNGHQDGQQPPAYGMAPGTVSRDSGGPKRPPRPLDPGKIKAPGSDPGALYKLQGYCGILVSCQLFANFSILRSVEQGNTHISPYAPPDQKQASMRGLTVWVLFCAQKESAA